MIPTEDAITQSAAEQAATIRESLHRLTTQAGHFQVNPNSVPKVINGEVATIATALDALVARCEQAERWEPIAAERGVRMDEIQLRAETAERRVQQLETALRPFAEKWDLHAAPYLADCVDGEEARVLTARTVDEMISDITVARAALETDPSPDKEKAA